MEDGAVPEPQSRDAPGRMVCALEYFRNIPLYTKWRDHNVVLKFLREECESMKHKEFC